MTFIVLVGFTLQTFTDARLMRWVQVEDVNIFGVRNQAVCHVLNFVSSVESCLSTFILESLP